MLCFVSFIVLSILGIFSASHRALAKEAFDCVFRRVTLRPCNTGFDIKIKAKILGALLNRSPALARFVNRRFELLAWVFMLLIIVSTFYTLRGVTYYYLYGSCNGLNDSGFCVFDPAGDNNQVSSLSTSCSLESQKAEDLDFSPIDWSEYMTFSGNNSGEVIFIGCYSCPYTRQTYPVIRDLVKDKQTGFTLAHFPTKGQTEYLLPYDRCLYTQDSGRYLDYVDRLFSEDAENIADETFVRQFLPELGYDLNQVDVCLADEATATWVKDKLTALEHTGLYGTPTVLINGRPIVGPKPPRVYERLLSNSFFSRF